jgi:hypothetical protein
MKTKVILTTCVLLASAIHCDGVSFMPSKMVFHGAKDVDEEKEMLDVHTFNHFYTF